MHAHRAEFEYMKQVIRRNGVLPTLAQSRSLKCIGIGRFRLHGTSVREGLDVVFCDVALNTIWNTFNNMKDVVSIHGIPAEMQTLARMRDAIDPELPDKLFFFFCARESFLWPEYHHTAIREAWNRLDEAVKADRDSSEEMEILTDALSAFCRKRSKTEARLELLLLRDQDARMTDMMRM